MRIALAVDSLQHLRPTTPHTQPLPGITRTRFSLIRYRSPLHTESQLFSSPTGTEMFHFPASTPTQTMYSPAGNTTQLVLGFPIRTSSDQRFVGNSPRHNAASHVLHRLSMPRHPPYARNKTHGHTNNQGINTKTQKRKILASTIQFSHNTTPHTNNHTNAATHVTGPNRNNQCCPRHPTVHQCKNFRHAKFGVSTNPNTTQHTPHTCKPPPSPPSVTEATCGHASTRQTTRGSRTLGDINHTRPQLRAHKNKAP